LWTAACNEELLTRACSADEQAAKQSASELLPTGAAVQLWHMMTKHVKSYYLHKSLSVSRDL